MNEAGYAITETLSQDENAKLYRALRRSDRMPVVLKVLGPQTHQLRELERLRNELEIAGELDQPSVLRPLMLVMHEGLPALVSEDFAGVPLEIVNQLNQGRSLIAPSERIPFAEPCLRAGRKAMAAAAHATAGTHFDAGVAMLPAEAWETVYELAFALHLEAARAAFFAGDADGARRQLQDLHSLCTRPGRRSLESTRSCGGPSETTRSNPFFHALSSRRKSLARLFDHECNDGICHVRRRI